MTKRRVNKLFCICLIFSMSIILFSSCVVGYVYTINNQSGRGYFVSKDNNVSVYVASTHTQDASKSINLTVKYYTEGEYLIDPNAFALKVAYPDDHHVIAPVIKTGKGILNKTHAEAFYVEGKESIIVQFKIECDTKFDLSQIDIDIIPSTFITKKGKKVITDPLRITSVRIDYR